MFHLFRVSPEHCDFLPSLWLKENNPSKSIAEFQKTVHLSVNWRSPVVATYGLRKTVEHDKNIGIKKFVERNFYMDEGLVVATVSFEFH